MDTTNQKPLELWGGVECTINRVGDQFFSQLARNGHRDRLDDLDRFAELGMRALRFPILWEELAPDSLDCINWHLVDPQLQRLRVLGIRPIVGLVHHGSGPRYTSLIDPDFPAKLALFARKVAERYPWIDAFTPVNEPLTTARFSGLYGHWYPHGRDGVTFARALLNQCRGVVLAMQAVRQVNASAELIQTDDLGKTFSRPKLAYQADFENDRRWITWDLLSGRINREHPMWSYLDWLGIAPEAIENFEQAPCPPDIIGLNYYITSERFLDDNLRDHPPESCGGNGRDRYADVAAVRVRTEGIAGPEAILREACARYNLPVAITEAHLGCTREEQLRWFKEVWDAALALRAENFAVRAVTAWSLLGAYDWNSLLTRQDNHYESGAFDLRGESPRPTAIAKMIRDLARENTSEHPVLATPGWWHRDVRMIHPIRDDLEASRSECAADTEAEAIVRRTTTPRDARPILITGGGGRLAEAFVRNAKLRGLAHHALTRRELDIANEDHVADALERFSPWAVLNCAGFSRVDDAEGDEEGCVRSNVTGAEVLATACARAGTALVTFSSDYVFDGGKREPYTETDDLEALNVYGETKILGERRIFAALPEALVIRPGEVFAPSTGDEFLSNGLRSLAHGEPVRVANDIRFSRSYVSDLAHATLDLLIDGEKGVWHLANAGDVTPFELLVAAADIAQLDPTLIEGVPAWSLNWKALRPRNRALRSERGQLLPPWMDALHRWFRESPPVIAQPERAVATR